MVGYSCCCVGGDGGGDGSGSGGGSSGSGGGGVRAKKKCISQSCGVTELDQIYTPTCVVVYKTHSRILNIVRIVLFIIMVSYLFSRICLSCPMKKKWKIYVNSV